MRIYPLDNPVQRYAWGSADGITKALGIANPGGGPIAELWMGAHPSAPSRAIVDGARIGLDELIETSPREFLGEAVEKSLGRSLPFLFKVLSAGTPLSIQAHPNKKKAQLGFEQENRAGIPVDAPERNYRDPNHKPEMAVALTRFELICGFRPVAEILANMRLAAPAELERSLGMLERDPSRIGLSVFFYSLMSADSRAHERLLASASERIASALSSGSVPAGSEGAFRWSARIMEIFPGDVGAILPLVLNHIVLEPGQAAFIAPGELHAHLAGTCLEIMANSDNVIRGALTKKFVDLTELASVLSFNPGKLDPVGPSPVAPFEEAYPAYVPDFRISRIALGPGDRYERSSRCPEILLCGAGAAEIACPGEGSLKIRRGEAAFVAWDAPDYGLRSVEPPGSPAEALVFRASVPPLP